MGQKERGRGHAAFESTLQGQVLKEVLHVVTP